MKVKSQDAKIDQLSPGDGPPRQAYQGQGAGVRLVGAELFFSFRVYSTQEF